MDDNNQLRESCYNFFKEEFNVDLTKMTSLEIRMLIDDLNKEINSMIINEENKRQNLLNNYYNMYNEYMKLREQLALITNPVDNE